MSKLAHPSVPSPTMAAREGYPRPAPIAIVGMAVRLPTPGADGTHNGGGETAFSAFLDRETPAFRPVPDSRWQWNKTAGADRPYTQTGAFLDDVITFDPAAFSISPGEAAALDPQHRILLELSWHALENAGISWRLAREVQTGVFIGASFDDYRTWATELGQALPHDSARFLGGVRGTMAGRISHAFNLTGPAMVFDSTCSTGLLTVHQACLALSSGECGLALAGAANLLLHPESWLGLCASGALSPTGSSRPFDNRADGYVRGEGAAIFVLAPLETALARGMRIRGILRGSAVNHDGTSNGLTAPNGTAQEAVIRDALRRSGTPAERIGLIEAHGTGTRLGDPIEANALSRVFSGTDRKNPILLMALKAVTGHLESAAGCVGLARLVLAGEQGFLHGQAGCETPNHLIPWDRSPLVIARGKTLWPEDDQGPMCAGISAFGLSGTNVHMVFEPAGALGQHSPAALRADPIADRIIPCSAQDDVALDSVCAAYRQALATTRPEDVARAAQTGRTPLRHRSAIVTSADGAVQATIPASMATSGARNSVWLFNGQGSQSGTMGAALFRASDTFRRTIERCSEAAEAVLGERLDTILYGKDAAEQVERRLLDTAVAQPALFAVQVGLAALWKSYGLSPTIILGHSVGEIAAACSLGVLSVEEGARLAALRGRFMREHCVTDGAMLAVMAPPARLREVLERDTRHLSLAAHNGPDQCVLSGTSHAVEAASQRLDAHGIRCTRLAVSHAFHSPLMEAARDSFAEALKTISFSADVSPSSLFVSTVTGSFLDAHALAEPAYWLSHMRAPVLFDTAIRTVLDEHADSILEIGPKPALGGQVLQIHGDSGSEGEPPLVLPSLDPKRDDLERTAETLGALFVHGENIAWPEAPCSLAATFLPLYPFQRQPYWWPTGEQVENRAIAYAAPSSATSAAAKAINDDEAAVSIPDALRAIWEQWLPARGFGRDEDFFAVGGNSLIAAQIVLAIRKRFAPGFSMAAFLTHPTLAKLEKGLADPMPVEAGTSHELPIIRPDQGHRYQPFPLNDMQHAYWIGRRGYFDGNKVGIHVYFELDRTDLDPDRFRHAWHQVLQRHDMLHAIVTEDGQQCVLKDIPPYQVPDADLSSLSPELRATRLDETRQALEHRLFDLSVWPQFDIRIHHLPDSVSRIHFAIDGWCVDGWSYQVLFNDLIHFYDAPAAELPGLDITFRDYVLTMQELERSDAYQRDLEYWQGRLPALPAAPALPGIGIQSNGRIPEFTRRECAIDAADWARIKEQAGRVGVSAATVMLSLYADTLSLWAETPHFCINVPRFNRLPLHPQVDLAIGEFATFTLLEVKRQAGQPFAHFARGVQEQMWRDLDHGLVSGVRILRELARTRSVPKSGAMPYVFTMAPEQMLDGRMRSLMGTVADLGTVTYMLTETPQVWIDCQYHEDGDGFRLSWDSLDGHFPAGLVEAMFGAFSAAVRRLATDDTAWNDAQLVTLPEDQARRRTLSNDTAAPVPADDLFTLFARRAAARPDAEAIIDGDVRLTYAQTLGRVHALAAHLADAGVRPGDRVAILQPRGWVQPVSAMAILGVGAAYVPLDPKAPARRLETILRDCAPVLCLTAEGGPRPPTGQDMPPALAVDNLPLDRDPAPLPSRAPDSLAYIIYTSGSTGTPKGVMVADRSVVNMLDDTNRIFAITALHHDLSVYDLFGGLCGGAAIILPDDRRDRDAAHWLERLRTELVSFWNSVPATMDMLLAVAAQTRHGIGDQLRLVILGGDWVPVTLPTRLAEQAPAARLVTIGGPTETTVWNIFHEVVPKDADGPSIPYGAPAANAAYFIRDALGRERPDHAIGQMLCAGEGVARGYWNAPTLTAEKFFDDPLTGQRLYATGDMGCWLPGGEIRFIGRDDGQVKINGMRIETAEIEATLTRRHDIAEAAVVVAGSANKKIVAFVVGSPFDPDDLKADLAGSLPAHMVPAHIHLVPTLPVTGNGKIDRTALCRHAEEIDGRPPPDNGVDDSALDPLMHRIAALWQEAVGLLPVTSTAHFFKMGGDSLQATRLSLALRKAFGGGFGADAVFRHPSLAEQAAAARSTKDAVRDEEISRSSADGSGPISWAQRRLWLLNRLEPEGTAYNLPFILRMNGALDVNALRAAVGAVFDRHAVLRSYISLDGEEVCLTPIQPWVLPLRIEDAHPDDVPATAAEEAHAPFNLGTGPLARMRLLVHGDRQWTFFLTLHHIIFDGWSIGLFLSDLSQAYQNHLATGAATLPPLAIQYADYAAWQVSGPGAHRLDEGLAYWRQALDGLENLTLPTDHSRPPRQNHQGAMARVTLSPELGQRIDTFARSTGTTAQQVLLSAFALTLRACCGQDDVAVGVPVAARTVPDVEPLIGFFVNTLVVRLNPGQAGCVAELLAQARETMAGAQRWQDTPFARIVEDLAPPRDPSRNPLYQVGFDVQRPHGASLSLPGVEATFVEPPVQTTHTDLDFTLFNQQEGGFLGYMTYATALFEPSTIDRMLALFLAITDALTTADPDTPLAALPSAGASDLAFLDQLDGPQLTPRFSHMHEAFAAQVAASPDSPAVTADDRIWTRQELWYAAERISAGLADRTQPGERVAVCLRRSPEWIATILALHRLGVAVAMIDPALPRERQQAILDALEAPLLIDDGTSGIAVTALLRHPVKAVSPSSTSEEAFIVFTSGSTGRPKGVRLGHGALMNRLAWGESLWPWHPGDMVCQKTAQSFVDVLAETWGPLVAGVPLVIAPEEVAASPALLTRYLANSGATRLTVAPAVLGSLLDAGLSGQTVPSLSLILCSGERLAAALIKRVRRAFPAARLWNIYGSTEVTADATACDVTDALCDPVPIGCAAANSRILVLDSADRPVPLGAPGRLVVEGACVALGYLAAKDDGGFRPDTPARFDTGDLGRWRPDGMLDHLGRRDRQVKIRGIRVEPAEVEATLGTLDEVVACAVTGLPDGNGDMGLAAYIVPRHPGLDGRVLRSLLRTTLPDAFIPGRWAFVDTIPGTINGKIDWRAFTANRSEAEASAAPPQGAIEEKLADLWRGFPEIGDFDRHDDFFLVGGHSLTAARLSTRIEAAWEIAFPLADIFSCSGFTAMACAISYRIVAAPQRAGAEMEEGEI